MSAEELGGLNFPAGQRLCLKHSLEPEGGLRVGLLRFLFLNRLLFLNGLLFFRFRIPIRH